MNVSLKTFLPAIALGTVSLVSCHFSNSSSTKDYMDKCDIDNQAIQIEFNSRVYQDNFKANNAIKDSLKVAVFNKIVSEMKPAGKILNTYSCIEKFNKNLGHKSTIKKRNRDLTKALKTEKNLAQKVTTTQPGADVCAFRTFFRKIKKLDYK